jgi:putative flippase GtrA
VIKVLRARHRVTFVQFLKFGTVGVAGFALDNALVYFGIYALGLGRVAAGFASFPIVVTFTWFGNRIFTFRHADRSGTALQWARFAAVCAIGLVFNRGTYSLLVSTVPMVYAYPVLGLLAGTAAGMFFNFFMARRVVFK